MEKQVAGVKDLAVRQKDIFSYSNGRYYTSVARGVQAAMPCLIHFRTSRKKEFRDEAQTWSRMIQVSVAWPQERTFYRPEHFIIYDENMALRKPAAAARCIAHELFHVLAHEPTSLDRKADEHGRIKYTKQQEEDADIFSLLLLMNRQYSRKLEAPLTFEQLVKLLQEEAGKPAWLSWKQIKELKPYLEWKEAWNT